MESSAVIPQLHGEHGAEISLVPVDAIHVINPRLRGERGFKELCESIATVGLKKPITVTPSLNDSMGTRFNLICGQGRLEAFKALGIKKIPAAVIEATLQDCYVLSLVENIARRRHSRLELLRTIGTLADKGYSPEEISKKTSLEKGYIASLLLLLNNGEERLILAVENDQMPIRVALEIARCEDSDFRRVLQDAYEANILTGTKLLQAKRVVERRIHYGKQTRLFQGSRRPKATPQSLVKAYQDEVQRQRLLIQKAERAERDLLILVTALKQLSQDSAFLSLLDSQGLSTLPKYLAQTMEEATR